MLQQSNFALSKDRRPVITPQSTDINHLILITNPTSGSYDKAKVDWITSELSRHGMNPTVIEVRTPADVALALAEVCLPGSNPFIIVAAGDGTFNAVINAIGPGSATLGIVPLGTSNVLALELGVESVEQAVFKIIQGNTQPLPVGRIQLADCEKYFVLMAGIGLDGQVVRDVRANEKRWLKQGAYGLSALRAACSWNAGTCTLKTNQQEIVCHSVIICNAPKYGGRFTLAHGADLFTPQLSVVCVHSSRRRTYLQAAWQLARGQCLNCDGITSFTATELEVTGSKAIQIDGDYVGCGPAKLSVTLDFAEIII